MSSSISLDYKAKKGGISVGALVFLIAFVASTLGAIGGFGGGVIIKPVLDATGIMSVSSISFLSGCTALTMALSSLIRQRNNHIELRYRTTTPLAIGSVGGGILGKVLFELIRANATGEQILGGVQAVSLALITAGVLLYVINKHRLHSCNVENTFFCLLIGCFLGFISSFLGIGGGTSNVAVLFFFFSMDAKTAAKNSLYIIVFSQISSILISLVTRTVPPFRPIFLLLMGIGAICGALLGSRISKKCSNRGVEFILKSLLTLLVIINATNAVNYFSMA